MDTSLARIVRLQGQAMIRWRLTRPTAETLRESQTNPHALASKPTPLIGERLSWFRSDPIERRIFFGGRGV